MSNQDSFIDEVTEEVRRDRLYALMRRYGWIAVTAVIVLVVGASVFEWRRSAAQAEAEATGDALRAALSEPDAGARLAALEEVDANGAAGRAALLALMTAAAETEAGENEAALARLDGVIADAEAPAVFRDLAALKASVVGPGMLTPDERLSRLTALTVPGNPFRLLALEQTALAEVEKGETDAALDTLRSILADAAVTPDLRERATQLIVALGGTANAVN